MERSYNHRQWPAGGGGGRVGLIVKLKQTLLWLNCVITNRLLCDSTVLSPTYLSVTQTVLPSTDFIVTQLSPPTLYCDSTVTTITLLWLNCVTANILYCDSNCLITNKHYCDSTVSPPTHTYQKRVNNGTIKALKQRQLTIKTGTGADIESINNEWKHLFSLTHSPCGRILLLNITLELHYTLFVSVPGQRSHGKWHSPLQHNWTKSYAAVTNCWQLALGMKMQHFSNSDTCISSSCYAMKCTHCDMWQ